MKTTFEGTILGGEVHLDERVDFADQSRVYVTIVPVEQWAGRWQGALAALEELKASHPINSGGLRYTREQLHERR